MLFVAVVVLFKSACLNLMVMLMIIGYWVNNHIRQKKKKTKKTSYSQKIDLSFQV